MKWDFGVLNRIISEYRDSKKTGSFLKEYTSEGNVVSRPNESENQVNVETPTMYSVVLEP